MLVAHGHAPIKAAEIVLDASRGRRYALDWIRAVRGPRLSLHEQRGRERAAAERRIR
jgi:hypothetical protein